MARDGFPTGVVHRPMAEHFEVLDIVVRWRVGVREGIGHRLACNRELLNTAVHRRRLDADDVVNGWRNIGDVMELVANCTAISDPRGPMHHKRNMDPTFVSVLLVPPKRRISCLRPAPWIVRMRIRATDFWDAIDGFVGSFDHEVEELHLVQNAERPAFLTRSVVGHHHDDGVI